MPGHKSKITEAMHSWSTRFENALTTNLLSLAVADPSIVGNLTQQITEMAQQLRNQQTELRQTKNTLSRTLLQLEKTSETYRTLYESSPVGYFNLSRKGIILNVNNKACELLGREKDQLIGQSFSAFVHHSSQHNYYQHTNNINILRTEPSIELKFVRKHGLPFHAMLELSCRKNKRGAVVEILVLLHDISERIEYEQALIAEMDRAQVTLHSIGDGVITTDTSGIIDYMNPIAEALTGCPMQLAISQNLYTVFRVINEHTRSPLNNLVQKCLRENRVISSSEDCTLIGHEQQEYAIQYSIAPLRNRNGRNMGVVVVFSNITEARAMAQKIAHQATHDSLTGLVNRREFEKRLGNALQSVKDTNAQHCLCYLDLDQFKIVNDTAGHVAGDELLRKLTFLLKSKTRGRDTLARHGGDEFGLILDNCPIDQAYKISNSLVAAVRNFHFEWENRTFNIGVSIGLVPITKEAETTAELMSQADVACYTAKDLGRNRVHLHQNEDSQLVSRYTEMQRVAGLNDTLKAGRFRLYCQSIVPLSLSHYNGPLHYEILLRAVDINGRIELPKSFVPAAERYGMMSSIDRWVITNTCHRYVQLFNTNEPITIAINLSGNSLADPNLFKFVRNTIFESGIPAERLCFEITETAAISNLENAREFIRSLRDLGCQFALDDFGSGLSSFTYLKNLPVDYLKIDGHFVQDMIDDPTNEAMVAAINQVGHIMGIKTIAECAENANIVNQLRKLGVDYAQGYAISTPMPIDVVASKLNQFKSVPA